MVRLTDVTLPGRLKACVPLKSCGSSFRVPVSGFPRSYLIVGDLSFTSIVSSGLLS